MARCITMGSFSDTIIGTSDKDNSDGVSLWIAPQRHGSVAGKLMDPFRVSTTIIGTWLPRTQLGIIFGLSGMLHKVHGPVPWADPFTEDPFPVIPQIIGTSDDIIGANPTTASQGDGRYGPHASWSELTNCSNIWVCIYIFPSGQHILSYIPRTQSIWAQSLYQ